MYEKKGGGGGVGILVAATTLICLKCLMDLLNFDEKWVSKFSCKHSLHEMGGRAYLSQQNSYVLAEI